jgi:hypothetical protein
VVLSDIINWYLEAPKNITNDFLILINFLFESNTTN